MRWIGGVPSSADPSSRAHTPTASADGCFVRFKGSRHGEDFFRAALTAVRRRGHNVSPGRDAPNLISPWCPGTQHLHGSWVALRFAGTFNSPHVTQMGPMRSGSAWGDDSRGRISRHWPTDRMAVGEGKWLPQANAGQMQKPRRPTHSASRSGY